VDSGAHSLILHFSCTYSDMFDSDLITSGAECIYSGTGQSQLASRLERVDFDGAVAADNSALIASLNLAYHVW
jgi:hypothetical protein